MSAVRMIANLMGIELLELEVTVTGEVDVRGALMLSTDVPVGFKSIGCATRIVPEGREFLRCEGRLNAAVRPTSSCRASRARARPSGGLIHAQRDGES